MIEKDALIGVIAPVCSRLRVPYFAIRGNVSQIPIRDAGMRMAEQDRQVVVLYLGDHDPSGIDITRDLEERLTLYARREIEVRRIALTMNQIKRHRLPPNPAKESDANLGKYVSQFGTRECWELDALATHSARGSDPGFSHSHDRPEAVGGCRAEGAEEHEQASHDDRAEMIDNPVDNMKIVG